MKVQHYRTSPAALITASSATGGYPGCAPFLVLVMLRAVAQYVPGCTVNWMRGMAEYDSIAREYRESKGLAFREHVERYTLFELLGDVRGKTVLDLACGDGFYTRLLRQAGAAEVTGVDVSEGMIELAEDRGAAATTRLPVPVCGRCGP